MKLDSAPPSCENHLSPLSQPSLCALTAPRSLPASPRSRWERIQVEGRVTLGAASARDTIYAASISTRTASSGASILAAVDGDLRRPQRTPRAATSPSPRSPTPRPRRGTDSIPPADAMDALGPADIGEVVRTAKSARYQGNINPFVKDASCFSSD